MSLGDGADGRQEQRGRPDSHFRALTKAVTWRIIGTLDTFLWSWLITGHPVDAGAIASLETVTKIILYYLHERVWRLAPMDPHSHARSLSKAITWRIAGSLDTFVLSLIVTGKLKYAISIASVEALTKIVLYYVHERAWRRIAWGRLESVEEDTASAFAPPQAIEPENTGSRPA